MEKKAIIGKKVGMTQIFDEAGKVVPVTVIEAGPCTVVQKKTAEKDGYEAVQLGYQPTTEKHLTKGQKGHLAKAGAELLCPEGSQGRQLRQARSGRRAEG